MEFKSLSDLIQIVDNQMATAFYGDGSVIRKRVIKVLSSIIGAALYMITLVSKNIWKNRFVYTCDVNSLDGFGAEYCLPHKPPVYATGFVKVSVEGNGSVSIPSGTFFVDSEVTNMEYQTISDETVVNGSEIRVVAAIAGSESNIGKDSVLQFRDSVPTGVGNEVVVCENGISGGRSVDVVIDGENKQWGETPEEYRSRLQDRVQNTPQGGSKNDYKGWALRFNFVTDAYVIAGVPKVNSVVVALANFESGSSVALTDSQVSEVDEYICADDRRPITADVRVMSVTPVTFNVCATVTPYSDSVRESVNSAIVEVLRKVGPGESMTFDDVRIDVLANSTAKTFVINSVIKGIAAVNEFDMVLSVPTSPESSVAPVAEIANVKLTLSKGVE